MMSNPLYRPSDGARGSGAPSVREDEEGRIPYRKDYSRLLHAPAFRRLQGKTQLFPGSESDFFRNRLTHSLEVAQIAEGIASRLNATEVPAAFGSEAAIDIDLVQFAALAHDLGHPPFGHNGEAALDDVMREHGGFEGNAQTLRILTAVERKLVRCPDQSLSDEHGLDLTYRSLASVLKYDREISRSRPRNAKLEKGYYETERRTVEAIKRAVIGMARVAKFKTIECAIMDVADDIAYSTYDLEDCLHAGFVSPLLLANALSESSPLSEAVLRKTNKAMTEVGHAPIVAQELLAVLARVFKLDWASERIEATDQKDASLAQLVQGLQSWTISNQLKTDSLSRTRMTAERVGQLIRAVELQPHGNFACLSGVRLRPDPMLEVEVLKHLTYELVIRSPRMAVAEHRGREIVTSLFDTLRRSGGDLLPDHWKQRHSTAKSKSAKMRVLCDYVAGMTDRHAIELYGRLFGGGISIFKPL